jgi:5-formyltetrahydrofolate cyclo-ligase
MNRYVRFVTNDEYFGLKEEIRQLTKERNKAIQEAQRFEEAYQKLFRELQELKMELHCGCGQCLHCLDRGIDKLPR